jgi:hypothetical protein
LQRLIRGQNLDGDATLKLQIARQTDHAHPAAPQGTYDFVTPFEGAAEPGEVLVDQGTDLLGG